MLNKLTELESERAVINTEIAELNKLQFQPVPPLSNEEIIALSRTLSEKLTLALPDQVRTVLLGFVHKIKVHKNEEGQIMGTVTYYLSNTSPPFELPLPEGTGYNLPIE